MRERQTDVTSNLGKENMFIKDTPHCTVRADTASKSESDHEYHSICQEPTEEAGISKEASEQLFFAV